MCYQVLDLDVSMLPSVNEQHGYNTRVARGPVVYTKADFARAQKQMRSDALVQVAQARWRVSATDRYTVISSLPVYIFTPEKAEKPWSENHNPWKPMIDVLEKAGVFYNDKLIEQEILTRQWETNPRNLLAHFRIYKAPYGIYRPAPAMALFDDWYRAQYTTP